MISIIDFDPSIIPQLLIYVVPGYLGIKAFQFLSSAKLKTENVVWLSCVFSYTAITIANIIFPEKIMTQLYCAAALASIICIAGGIIANICIQSTRIRDFCINKMHFSPAPSVIGGAIRTSGCGSSARVYIKDCDYYVEGAVYAFTNNSDDPYISLSLYSFYNHGAVEPFYVCKNTEKQFIINLNDVKHIELWPAKR